MAWPDVLRWLALIVGGTASLMGLVWTLRCIFRPWMREAAREAADGLYEAAPGQRLPAAMKGLVDRIERVDARGRGDRAAMEARIGEQLERMGARIVDRVREDRAAILEALATPRDRPGA